MIIKNITGKFTSTWLASFFTLGSSIFKFKLGLLSLSPTVLLPMIALAFIPKLRKIFLNEHLRDKNFVFSVFFMLCFMSLMVLQTIFSDWQLRALSETIKTFLFFFLTHAFYTMLVYSKNLIFWIRVSIIISICFVLYLSYIYITKFGATYIGVEIDTGGRAGINTLALFIFFNIVMSVSLLSYGEKFGKTQYLNFFIFSLLFGLSLITGSRFGIVFPILFLFPIIASLFFKTSIKKKLLFNLIIFLGLAFFFVLYFFSSLQNLFNEGYFLSIERLINFGENNSDSVRLILLYTGIDCFFDNNIIIGHGVKDYLNCTLVSSLKTDYILHNDHLSILNNVGILGYLFWIFAIFIYSKIFHFSRENFIFRFGTIIYIFGLLLIDGYNSPILALLLAFSRWEWLNSRSDKPTSKN